MADTEPMTLGALLKQVGLPEPAGDARNLPITSVTEDSREVGQGSLFVAVTGGSVDGHAYIDRAIARGARAVVAERDVATPDGVALIRTDDTRLAVARLAAAVTGLTELQASGHLQTIGVTGTNGKSTFCYLMRSILQEAGRRPALLGTVVYDLIGRQVNASLTTPVPTQLAAMLVEAADAGADCAVLEASSQALDQRRVSGVRFDVGVFTNLTGDHLDYHGDMDTYCRAKKRLFDDLADDAGAVVNADDPWSDRLLADCVARVIRYGTGDVADVRAVVRRTDLGGTAFDLHTPSGVVPVEFRLVGHHNVSNALAAAATGVALGVGCEAIRRGLEAVDCVPGRLQRVDNGGVPICVLVDYAHTDDALRNVLTALQGLKTGRLTVVFGCGGDRDRTKRARMGRVAAALADTVVVTSDNPRNERPNAIIEQILAGIDADAMARVTVEPDRRAAIEHAIETAEHGDLLLIAGKGHETYQDIGGTRIAFDDVAIASDALAARFGDGGRA